MSDDDDFDNDTIILAGANDNATDDIILPFQLEVSNLRGRVVRLGDVLTDILDPHHYPQAVARLVGEGAGLTLLLGGMLKFEGVFTLQAQGDGPVRMVICDLTTGGELRAMAGYNTDKLTAAGIDATGHTVVGLRPSDQTCDLKTLMGAGHLAFTVDQGEHTERYQGIVELNGADLAECVGHYFAQSEQIETVLKVAAGMVNGAWRAGGIMLQRLPVPATEQTPERLDQATEDWDRAIALLHTCTRDELIHDHLEAQSLLYRLFHEEGVRVFNPIVLSKGCRCSMEKLRDILATMPDADIEHMTVDGKVTMTCEFCNQDFDFTPGEIKPTVQ